MDLGTLVEGYSQFTQAHPHISNIATAELIYVTGDIISQRMGKGPVNWRQVGYTAASAPVYGLCIEGLMETGDIAGKVIHDDPLTKSALGPNLWGNLYNAWFFAHRTIGMRNGWSATASARDYWTRIKETLRPSETPRRSRIKEQVMDLVPMREYLISAFTTVTAWNAVQYINYDKVPEHMQTPFVLGAALVWTAVLSTLSLTGMSRKTSPMP